jgi:hypothetical protein
MAGLLSRERTIAGPGFNRWLIPPCALATHLCIGQVYALSVFNLPLTRQLGVTKIDGRRLAPHRARPNLHHRHLVLGTSPALFGKNQNRDRRPP